MTVLAAPKGLANPLSAQNAILEAQWDASTLGLANGAAVNSCPDSSGQGRTLVAGAVAPTYATGIQNGLGVIRCAGTGWMKYLGPTVEGSAPWFVEPSYTFFVVYIRRVAVNNSTPLTTWNAADTKDFNGAYTAIAGFEGGTAVIVQHYRQNVGNAPSVAHPGNNVAILATHQTIGGNSQSVTINATTSTVTPSGAGWQGLALQNFYVGCRYDKAQNAVDGSFAFFNGDICEIRIYRGNMSSAATSTIQAALKAKWGTP